jgi:hypothetical protein
MNHKHFCMIFGIVPGVCSKVVCAMLRLAVRRLAGNPITEVRFPSAEKNVSICRNGAVKGTARR